MADLAIDRALKGVRSVIAETSFDILTALARLEAIRDNSGADDRPQLALGRAIRDEP